MALREPDGTTEWLKVKVHPGLCEGWGNCHRWAPECYPLDDEGLIDIQVLEVPPEMARDAWRGAMSCPEGVITVVELAPRDDAQRPECVDAPR